MERHERVDAEEDRRQLDEDRNQQEHPDRGGQALIPVWVQSPSHSSSFLWKPATERCSAADYETLRTAMDSPGALTCAGVRKCHPSAGGRQLLLRARSCT